jgi:hypothetical protein
MPFLPTGSAGMSYKDISPDMMNPFNVYWGRWHTTNTQNERRIVR